MIYLVDIPEHVVAQAERYADIMDANIESVLEDWIITFAYLIYKSDEKNHSTSSEME